MKLSPASALEFRKLVELFNRGFSKYVVPLHLEANALREHIEVFERDDAAAADVLVGTAATKRLRLLNAPVDDPASRALAELGAEEVVRQHELLLRLS